MRTILKATVSLLVGFLAFVGIGVSVTEILTPHIWPSAMIGLPTGIFAGIVAVPFTYLAVTYWSERQETGSVSVTTQNRIRILLAGLLGFLGGGGLAMAIALTQPVGLATALLLIGLPAGVSTAVVNNPTLLARANALASLRVGPVCGLCL
jgi:hypothetical protein